MPVSSPPLNDCWADETSALAFKLRRQRSCASLSFDRHEHPLDEFEDGWDPAEFSDIEEIGYGNGGLVFKTVHLPSRTVTARKIFTSRIPSETRRKMLQRELLTLQKCCSPYILQYFGAIVSEFQVSLILEYMDRGSLSDILRQTGPLPEPILGKIALNVLNGLVYLYDELNMIHRDLKPSNILVNSLGAVKLCDFGDSVELINSKAGSVVGTMGYMAPERIQGHHYTVTSDVWSFGVTMMELATGLFPFAHTDALLRRQRARHEGNGLASMAIVELLEGITNGPLPALDPDEFSIDLRDFVGSCLIRDPLHRPTPMVLLDHVFVKKHRHSSLSSWVDSIPWV